MFRRPVKPRLPSAKLEHERLTSLINSMTDGVLAVDSKCRIQMYNGAALNILDINSPVQGHRVGEFLKPFDAKDQPIDLDALIAATTIPTTNRDLRIRYSDDSVINLSINIAPVHLGYGISGQKGFVLMLRDITREKSLEEERDEFISVVSHELRTPIAIAEGNISNAQYIVKKADAAKDDPVRKALEEAHSQVLFLADMINDLSTLSRAERGVLAVESEDIHVADLVSELESAYTAQAADKGLRLSGSITGAPVLHSSRLYVREVLQNFITNAIKYTEKGSVIIHARKVKKGVEFKVVDTGIGISINDQKRVFEKFFRSEDFRTRSTTGTGLGLYVTTKLARLLHAEIKVKSKLNHGSEFTILVPDVRTK
jgi:two-component system phosphate regulon sensor histidine kinase PhoR